MTLQAAANALGLTYMQLHRRLALGILPAPRRDGRGPTRGRYVCDEEWLDQARRILGLMTTAGQTSLPAREVTLPDVA